MNVITLPGTYIQARHLLGHPAFKGEMDVTLRINNGQVFYENQPLILSRKGIKALKLDMAGL